MPHPAWEGLLVLYFLFLEIQGKAQLRVAGSGVLLFNTLQGSSHTPFRQQIYSVEEHLPELLLWRLTLHPQAFRLNVHDR